jgi:hypothetical protein
LTTSSALKTGSDRCRCAKRTVLPASSLVTRVVASCVPGDVTPKTAPYCVRNADARSAGALALVEIGIVLSSVARTKRATPVALDHLILTLPPVA